MTRDDDAGDWYFLGRARMLGMLVARNEEERLLLAEIQRRFGPSPAVPTTSKPTSELVPLTDREFETVRAALVEQFKPLREAYLRGMVVAKDDEQRSVLAELRRRFGRPRDS